MQVATDQGYDYTYRRDDPNYRPNRPDPDKPNGWLMFNGQEVPLWVFNVTTDFAMSGNTAQSARTRSFFAHNFQQPSIGVSVQLPSQRHLGDLAEFVRLTHRGMDSNTKLEIIGVKTAYGNGNMKGPHQNVAAEGYVKTIQREHMKQVWAPELTFQFVVEKMISPSEWADSLPTIRKLKSWHDIVESIMANSKGKAFVADPDANRPDPMPTSQPGQGLDPSRRP
jgi:hypothetical protein